VLELEENPEAKERIGICLVKRGAYAEAARLLKPSPSQEPEVLYYAGYALARLGQYSEALRRWEAIGHDTRDTHDARDTHDDIHDIHDTTELTGDTTELTGQKQKLLEIAVNDLLHRSRLEGEKGFDLGEENFNLAWQEAINLLSCYPDMPLVRDGVRLMCLHHLEALWVQ
jgi:tetratricopeptide (TPR) repeat protein